MRTYCFAVRPQATTPSGSSYYPVSGQLANSGGVATQNAVAMPMPADATLVGIGCIFDAARGASQTCDIIVRQSTDDGANWADAANMLIGDGTSYNTADTAYFETESASFSAGDLVCVELEVSGGTVTNDELAVTLIFESSAGQLLFGRAAINTRRTQTSDVVIGGSATSASGETYGLRPCDTGRFKNFYAWADGDGTWGFDLKYTDRWDTSGEATIQADIVTGVAPGGTQASGSNTSLVERVGPGDIGRSYFFEITEDSAATTGAYLACSCVFVPDRPGTGIYSFHQSRSDARYFWPGYGNASQGASDVDFRAPLPQDDFILRHIMFAIGGTPASGIDHDMQFRADTVSLQTVNATESAPVNETTGLDTMDDLDPTADEYITFYQAVTSGGAGAKYVAWALQDRDAFENPTSGDYVEATVKTSYQPGSTESDFSLVVDLKTVPQFFWATADTADSDKGTVKDSGGTEIPSDWFSYSRTTETGEIRILDDLVDSGTGSVTVRIYPPLAANSARSAAMQDGNAYDSNWDAYLPEGGGNDRTSNARNTTAGGGTVTPSVGDSLGVVGASTEYEDGHYAFGSNWIGGYTELTVMSFVHSTDLNSGGQAYVADWSSGNLLHHVNNGGGMGALVDDGSLRQANGGTLSQDEWEHVAMTYEGGVSLISYQDGSSVATQSTVGSAVATKGSDIRVGRSADARNFIGRMAHVSVHATKRSAAWITAEHDQLIDNFDFWDQSWTVGTDAGGGATAPPNALMLMGVGT